MSRKRSKAALGVYVHPHQRIRGEYPTVAASYAMCGTRDALRAAWYTPILSENKAQRVFHRMKRRVAALLEEDVRKAEYMDQRGDRMREVQRVRDVELDFADKVPCQRGSTGCYSSKDNRVWFRRHILPDPHPLARRVPTVFDPFTHLTHGALIHELAHAANISEVRVGRSHVVGPIVPGVPLEFRRSMRRDMHGLRFAHRLSQLAKIWCDTEGKSVCDFYCRRPK